MFKFVVALLVAAFGIVPATTALAVTYTYTGDTYTDLSATAPPFLNLLTSEDVSGWFTTTAALAPDMTYQLYSETYDPYSTDISGNSRHIPGLDLSLDPLFSSFLFSNGTVSFSSTGTYGASENISVTTDAAGNISGWSIYMLHTSSQYTPLNTYDGSLSSSPTGDSGSVDTYNGPETGQVAEAGTWTISGLATADLFTPSPVAPVPLPAGLPLLGSALAALGGFAWLRTRRRVGAVSPTAAATT